jgi:hypothetical protein
MKITPADNTEADLRKSRLVGFIIGLLVWFIRDKSRNYLLKGFV